MKNTFIIIGIVLVVVIAGVIYFSSMNNMEKDSDFEETNEEVSEGNDSYIDVSATQAKQLMDNNPDLIVIDVSPYYDEGHLPGAINYYPSSELQEAIPTLDSNAMYLVYCHADGPSRNGAQALIDAGFTDVYRLESHFSGWQSEGYGVEQ